ncbi:MAG: hypothetical protein V7L20_05745 [Nostoc sp.]|uniref:hypothetical protein n=1 Tax=Nostoc sp. TaxID=1180 RepID=UPI002FF4B8B0
MSDFNSWIFYLSYLQTAVKIKMVVSDDKVIATTIYPISARANQNILALESGGIFN